MLKSENFESNVKNNDTENTFWDVKQYIKTVKRLENGNKLCTDICNMIQDRIELEKSYSLNLRKWSIKWTSYLENGIEYGSTKQTWLGFCREAEELSDLHKDMQTKLADKVQTDVKIWQREHYHKATLPPQNLKEVKLLESEFEIAQKPWNKKLKKMLQCKKEYHQQCKLLRSHDIQYRNTKNDSSGSYEQLKKSEGKLRKSEKDTKKSKSLYEFSLNELRKDRERYEEQMTKVFNKSQEMEKERIEFFRSVFYSIQNILNLSQNEGLPEIYMRFESIIQALDPNSDIRQWSKLYGADVTFSNPEFEEYTPDLHCISKKKINFSNDSEVILTGVSTNLNQINLSSYDINREATDKGNTSSSNENEPSIPSFNMDKSFDLKKASIFSDAVQVRAIYDYNGIEEDELTLKKGDLFLKLEDEDEQGWCKGKKDDSIGLYPANYAELV